MKYIQSSDILQSIYIYIIYIKQLVFFFLNKKFMGAMSNSEDGKVHEKDVLKFFLGGAAQSYERRRNFASRSPMHAKLDHFIQYILDVEISNY